MRNTVLFTSILALISFSGAAQAAPHGIYQTRQMRELQRILRPYSTQSVNDGATQLQYYGGPVIANAKVYAVMWGSNVDATVQKQIGGFYSAALNSTYMDWLKEYDTGIKAVDGRAGTNQQIGRGNFAGTLTITPSNTSTTIDDKDIQAELEKQLSSGALPAADGNTLFMIYFPPGVTISIEGQTSCMSFCAYHDGYVSKTHGNVYYGVMPDQGGACSLGCAMGSTPFDGMTVVSSHEMFEAITDPFPTPGSTPAFPQAWNAPDGNEIGDLCAGNNTSVASSSVTYSVQQEFDNSISGCAAGPYSSSQ